MSGICIMAATFRVSDAQEFTLAAKAFVSM